MAHVMVSTEDALSFAAGSKQYHCDENGAVLVEDADIGAALAHGFRKATGEESNLMRSGITVTPAMVASMDRAALRQFLLDREKTVPPRTADMRRAVLDVVDEDADAAAQAAGEDLQTGSESQGDDPDKAAA